MYHGHKIHITLLKQLDRKLEFTCSKIVIYFKFYYLLFILLIYIDEKLEKMSVQRRNSDNKICELNCMRKRQDDVSGL